MSKRYIIDRKQDYLVPFMFEITSLKSNSGTETITAKSGYDMDSVVVGGGFRTEQTSYIFSGNALFNKAVAVGTLKIEAEADSYLSRSPYLRGNTKNIKLLLTKVEKLTSGNLAKRRNIFTFDIYYKNKVKSTAADKITSELIYSSTGTNYRDLIIDKITSGFERNNYVIPRDVNNSNIKIYGTPGSEFAIAINEHLLDTEVKEDGSTPTGRTIFSKNADVSILRGGFANAKMDFYGKEIDILKGTIGSKGVYNFNQAFPSAVLKSDLASAVSSSHTITLKDDISDVKVGDSVKIYGLKVKPKVHSIVSVDNKQVRLDQTVTASANALACIERKRAFGVEILPDLCSTLGPSIPTTRSIELTQYPDILITFKTTTATTDFTITHELLTPLNRDYSYGEQPNDRPPLMLYRANEYSTWSDTDEHTHSLFAPAKTVSFIPVFVKLKLLGSGGRTFSTTRTPNFSIITPHDPVQHGTPAAGQIDEGSDWTNSIPGKNGGTKLKYLGSTINLSTASVTNDTCEIWFNFNIKHTGIEDVVFELDLDKILTATTP